MDKDIAPSSSFSSSLYSYSFSSFCLLSFLSVSPLQLSPSPYEPVCIEVYNTGTAVENSLALSSVCDLSSILAVCWNTTWGWRWDLSTSAKA